MTLRPPPRTDDYREIEAYFREVTREINELWTDVATRVTSPITLDDFLSGIRPVSIVTSLPSLPDSDYPNNSIVILTTDSKLYRNDGGTWTRAVDGADLIANSVVAGKISAGAIAVSHLLVKGGAGGAINVDPNFLDETLWDAYSGSVTYQTISDGASGNKTVRSAVNSTAYLNDPTYYPIDDSKYYRFRFWARASATADKRLYACLRQYKSPGVPCDTNGGRSPYKPSGVYAHTNWVEYSGEWGPTDWQAGCKFVKIDFLLNYTNPCVGYWELQNVRFEEYTPGDLIVDGTIVANKLTFSNLAGLNSAEGAKLAGIATGADVTLSAIEGSLNVTGGGLVLSSGAKIESGYTAPGDNNSVPGVGLRISDGAIEAYGDSHSLGGNLVASDGDYMVSIGRYLTATGKAKRYPLHNSTNFTEDGQIHVYSWGTGWEKIATIGSSTVGSDQAAFYVPTTFTGLKPFAVLSNQANAIGYHSSMTGTGSYGAQFIGKTYGVTGSGDLSGGWFAGPSGHVGGPITLYPHADATAPTHSAAKGTLWVTSDGILYINTSGSTTWQKVGAQ